MKISICSRKVNKINANKPAYNSPECEAHGHKRNQKNVHENIQNTIQGSHGHIFDYLCGIVYGVIQHIVSPRSITERYQATNSMSRII